MCATSGTGTAAPPPLPLPNTTTGAASGTASGVASGSESGAPPRGAATPHPRGHPAGRPPAEIELEGELTRISLDQLLGNLFDGEEEAYERSSRASCRSNSYPSSGSTPPGLDSQSARMSQSAADSTMPPSLAECSVSEGSTSGGTRVWIHGSQLTRETSILFDRVPANESICVSPQLIKCTVPPARTNTLHTVYISAVSGVTGATAAQTLPFVYVPSKSSAASGDPWVAEGRARVEGRLGERPDTDEPPDQRPSERPPRPRASPGRRSASQSSTPPSHSSRRDSIERMLSLVERVRVTPGAAALFATKDEHGLSIADYADLAAARSTAAPGGSNEDGAVEGAVEGALSAVGSGGGASGSQPTLAQWAKQRERDSASLEDIFKDRPEMRAHFHEGKTRIAPAKQISKRSRIGDESGGDGESGGGESAGGSAADTKAEPDDDSAVAIPQGDEPGGDHEASRMPHVSPHPTPQLSPQISHSHFS